MAKRVGGDVAAKYHFEIPNSQWPPRVDLFLSCLDVLATRMCQTARLPVLSIPSTPFWFQGVQGGIRSGRKTNIVYGKVMAEGKASSTPTSACCSWPPRLIDILAMPLWVHIATGLEERNHAARGFACLTNPTVLLHSPSLFLFIPLAIPSMPL
jgi:hypothetical protein